MNSLPLKKEDVKHIMKISYSIGLDLGTNSVGWAVIDRNYEVLKRGGKRLWGVVLFEEGKSSVDYRLARSARRRLERRKERIRNLQLLMGESVNAVDEGFFRRLQTSFLANDSVDTVSGRDYRYNLFCGEYTDKDYYANFPTVYHLRHRLCNSDEKMDIRLVYLALHHIIKYRGHFLTDGDISTDGTSIDEQLQSLEQKMGEGVKLGDEYRKILLDTDKRKSDKVKALKQLGGNNSMAELVAKLLLGGQVKTKDCFGVDGLQFSFSSEYEEKEGEIVEKLNPEQLDLVNLLHEIYMQITLIGILGEGNNSISAAMINKYNKHREDLSLLKALLKENKSAYDAMFKIPRKRKGKNYEIANYANYVKTSTARTRYVKGAKREDFYKYVKQQIEKLPDSNEKQKVLDDIERETFMPRINDVSNSAIPYQLNLVELEKILDRQGEFYPELKDNKDNIISLLTFRRPYSVGVLNTSLNRGEKSKFCWLDQTIKEKVYPWNFEKLVDVDRANQLFIENMIGKDGFTDKPVLPLASVTYQYFTFLNEISNLKYKGKPFSPQLKSKLVSYAKNKKGTAVLNEVDIANIIKDEFGQPCEKEDLSGFAEEGEGKRKLISSLKTYRELRVLIGDEIEKMAIEDVDRIVEILTVFNDTSSKRRMLGKLFEEKGYDKEIAGMLVKKSYSGWGRFSRETLLCITTNEGTPRNIITLLKETDKNLQQILWDENYGIKEQTVGKRKVIEKPSYKSIIEPLYASSSVKKTIWQAYKVIEEVVKIMKCEPERVFIESTREDNTKKRTQSRYDKLKLLYRDIRKEVEYEKSVEEELDQYKEPKMLDDEKLYLYMTQLGKCMYTGKKLSLDRLSEYEVDHVVPRCFIKDDSLENKVLVIKEANQRKTSLALSHAIITSQKKRWEFLLSKKFISRKKFYNLTQNDWTEKDITGFINRQLTETSQINKLMAEVIKSVYPSLENSVESVKAGLCSVLRKYHTDLNPELHGSFYKLRSLNDFHHAKDAYLVAVIGTFNRLYFDGSHDYKYNYIKQLIEENKADEKKVKYYVNKRYGVLVDAFCNGVYSCVNEDGEEVSSTVAYNNFLSVMDRNDISVVKTVENYGESQFYKQTIYAKPEISGINKLQAKKFIVARDGEKIPLNPEIYGGYSQENQSYYLNVAFDKGKGRESKMIGIPALYAVCDKNGENTAIKKYLEKEGYINPEILGKPVGKFQLIRYQGQLVYIVSDNELSNAQQLTVDRKYSKMLSLIEKELKSDKKEKTFSAAANIENFDVISKNFVCDYVERVNKYYPLFKAIAQKVKEFVEDGFDSLEAKDKCQYIANLLVVTARGSGRVDMPKPWNGGSSWGRLSGKTVQYNEVDWINQSITGYYTSTVKAK